MWIQWGNTEAFKRNNMLHLQRTGFPLSFPADMLAVHTLKRKSNFALTPPFLQTLPFNCCHQAANWTSQWLRQLAYILSIAQVSVVYRCILCIMASYISARTMHLSLPLAAPCRHFKLLFVMWIFHHSCMWNYYACIMQYCCVCCKLHILNLLGDFDVL